VAGRKHDRLTPDNFSGIRAELDKDPRSAIVWVAPRGVGPTAWTTDPKKQTQIRRRFALLGQTLDGMRVWDVRRAIQAARSVAGLEQAPITLQGEGRAAGVALYAALFEPGVARLDLIKLPPTHRQAPDLLNVLQVLDIPQTVAMVAERSELSIHQSREADWEYPRAVAKRLGWKSTALQIDP
jgi:hypothetical protein